MPKAERRRWAYRAQALGAAGFFGFCRLLPLDLASGLIGGLARLIGPSLGMSKRARANLRLALPDLSERQIAGIVRRMWDNLGRVAAEYPHLRRLRVAGPGSRVETIGLEHVDRARSAARSIIFVSGHIANWEILPLASVAYEIPATYVYRAPNNPLIDRMIARFRGDGCTFAPKGSLAAREVVAALQRGEHLGLLVDQKMNDGIAVPFFGRPAMTAAAPATLALRFDCEVLPTRVERLAGARFRLTVYPPLAVARTGHSKADVAALMTQINATLERWIRERPEQWFWVHRRWPDPVLPHLAPPDMAGARD